MIYIKPVKFCKNFSNIVVRNQLNALGYNTLKQRHISIDRLLGTLPRPELHKLVDLLQAYSEAHSDIAIEESQVKAVSESQVA